MSRMPQLRSRWMPGADDSFGFPVFSRPSLCFWVTLLLLACAPAMPAQQLWMVDHDVVFIPQDGIALNAHTGRLLWRWPRFQGSTVTNGRGLLLTSYVYSINRKMHTRGTRLCRLNTRSGHPQWCHDFLQVRSWALDTSQKSIYVRQDDHVHVLNAANGRALAAFPLTDRETQLYPLPRGGFLLLDNGPSRTIAAFFHPGDRQLTWRRFPMYLHPFRGNGHGLLLYASERGEFFLPGMRLLYRRPAAAEGFPRAGSDEQGFIFTDREGPRPVLRGGTWDGQLWHTPPLRQQPSLWVRGGSAIAVERLAGTPAQTRLRLFNVSTGELRARLDLPAGLHVTAADPRGLLLQGGTAMLLLDLASARVGWQIDQSAGNAVLTSTAVVFWNSQGLLMGRARSNGALLWRDRVQFGPQHPH